MTVLLVVLTFLVLVAVDVALEARRAEKLRSVGASLQSALERVDPRWVAGIKLPEPLYYHPDHTWVHWVSPDLAYVGVDDFGRRLIGADADIKPPPVGTMLSQGEPTCTVRRGDREVQLRSPAGGEVIAVNPALTGGASAVHEDPYARGWIYKIRSGELFKEMSNLLRGSTAVRWMEDTYERFQRDMMTMRGSVIQDGGSPVEDIAERVSPDEWFDLVSTFLGGDPTPAPSARGR